MTAVEGTGDLHLSRHRHTISDGAERPRKDTMIASWSEWKRYPRARGEVLQAPIGPGIYEVRHVSSGALFGFAAVDNLAQALAQLQAGSKSWFSRRDSVALPDLEYRTFATLSHADAKIAAERVIGRREAFLSSVA